MPNPSGDKSADKGSHAPPTRREVYVLGGTASAFAAGLAALITHFATPGANAHASQLDLNENPKFVDLQGQTNKLSSDLSKHEIDSEKDWNDHERDHLKLDRQLEAIASKLDRAVSALDRLEGAMGTKPEKP